MACCVHAQLAQGHMEHARPLFLCPRQLISRVASCDYTCLARQAARGGADDTMLRNVLDFQEALGLGRSCAARVSKVNATSQCATPACCGG